MAEVCATCVGKRNCNKNYCENLYCVSCKICIFRRKLFMSSIRPDFTGKTEYYYVEFRGTIISRRNSLEVLQFTCEVSSVGCFKIFLTQVVKCLNYCRKFGLRMNWKLSNFPHTRFGRNLRVGAYYDNSTPCEKLNERRVNESGVFSNAIDNCGVDTFEQRGALFTTFLIKYSCANVVVCFNYREYF